MVSQEETDELPNAEQVGDGSRKSLCLVTIMLICYRTNCTCSIIQSQYF